MTKTYRTVPAEEILSGFSRERRKKINVRAAELIAEEFALRELREAEELTQEDVARRLGGRQVYISRLEKRADMKLSTLREYVGALGGKLELVVSFPKGRRVRLSEIGGASTSDKPSRKRRLAAARKSDRKMDRRR